MSEYKKTGNTTHSAMKADMDRVTARKYIKVGKGPAELRVRHTWRTRPDPLAGIWDEAERMLRAAPELEAKTLFEHFLARSGSGLESSHQRTFFRRVQHWRATQGPEREVFFAQEHQLKTGLRRNQSAKASGATITNPRATKTRLRFPDFLPVCPFPMSG